MPDIFDEINPGGAAVAEPPAHTAPDIFDRINPTNGGPDIFDRINPPRVAAAPSPQASPSPAPDIFDRINPQPSGQTGVIPGARSGDMVDIAGVEPPPADPGMHPIDAAKQLGHDFGNALDATGARMVRSGEGLSTVQTPIDSEYWGMGTPEGNKAHTRKVEQSAGAQDALAKSAAASEAQIQNPVVKAVAPFAPYLAYGAVPGAGEAMMAQHMAGESQADVSAMKRAQGQTPEQAAKSAEPYAAAAGAAGLIIPKVAGGPEFSRSAASRLVSGGAVMGGFDLESQVARKVASGQPLSSEEMRNAIATGVITGGVHEAIGAVTGKPAAEPAPKDIFDRINPQPAVVAPEPARTNATQSAEATPQAATDTAAPAPASAFDAYTAKTKADPQVLRDYLQQRIHANDGQFHIFGDTNEPQSMEKWAAVQDLARSQGYEIGEPINNRDGTISGSLEEAPPQRASGGDIFDRINPDGSLPSEPAPSRPPTAQASISDDDLVSAAPREPAATATEMKPDNVAPEAIPPEPAQPDEVVTSARKAMMAKDREALGLAGLNSPDRRTWQQVHDQAHDEGIPDRAMDVAREVQEKGRAMSDVETAGIVQHAAKLKNDHATLMDDIGKLSDPADIKLKSAEAERVQQDFDYLTQAIRTSGTEKGRALASQKLTLNKDYQLVSVLNRAKAMKGDDLAAPDKTRFEALSKQIDQHTARIAELEGKLGEQQASDALRSSRAKKYSKMTEQQRTAELRDKYTKLNELLRAGCNN